MSASTKRRPDVVTIIAIYHLCEAALMLLGLLAIGVGVLAVLADASGDPGILVSIAALGFGALFLLVVGGANVAVGLGLLRLKNWALWGAIILSAFRLPGIPIGTAIGGLTIYYLVQDETKAVFEAD